MAINNVRIASTSTAVFSAEGQQAITTIIFCNTSEATDATINVFAVPFGSNAGVTTQIINQVSIPVAETFVMDTERLILEDGDVIYAQASQSDVITATVSSVSTQ
jgi:hypothetical protein